MSYDRAGRTPSITVMNGKSTTALEMEHNIVDFVVLCETPWQNGNTGRQTQGNLAIPTCKRKFLLFLKGQVLGMNFRIIEFETYTAVRIVQVLVQVFSVE